MRSGCQYVPIWPAATVCFRGSWKPFPEFCPQLGFSLVRLDAMLTKLLLYPFYEILRWAALFAPTFFLRPQLFVFNLTLPILGDVVSYVKQVAVGGAVDAYPSALIYHIERGDVAFPGSSPQSFRQRYYPD